MFHPEVVHTPHGAGLLRRFTHDICGCAGDWTMAAFREEGVARIRAQVGDQRVICGLSGGVDSAVTAMLLHEAIGSQLTCIFVDNGLLRAGEAEEVVTLFRDHFNIPLVHVPGADIFLNALAGVTDPETKRKTIGAKFIEVFDAEAAKLGGADFLAQGTLYPDVIESVSFTGGPSVTTQEPPQCRRPTRLYADEAGGALARTVQGRSPRAGPRARPARTLRRPPPLPRPRPRHPHPRRHHQRKAGAAAQVDTIFLEEIRAHGLYDAIWQAFAVLLPVRTVGVMGDGRSYDQACALRAVTSTDGMTADYYPFPHEFLGLVATRIINEVRGINRVTYDITSKPPGTIEWE